MLYLRCTLKVVLCRHFLNVSSLFQYSLTWIQRKIYILMALPIRCLVVCFAGRAVVFFSKHFFCMALHYTAIYRFVSFSLFLNERFFENVKYASMLYAFQFLLRSCVHRHVDRVTNILISNILNNIFVNNDILHGSVAFSYRLHYLRMSLSFVSIRWRSLCPALCCLVL